MAWKKSFNLADRPPGSSRSITGYGAESLIIGRALLCGYNLFFKAWRDSKYDAVLEANKILFRVEFKGTSTENLTLTSGGRAGRQISRETASRERVLSTDDSELLIGIDSGCGICWIIPTEVVKILGKKQIPVRYLIQFKERWSIIRYLAKYPDYCRKILAYGINNLAKTDRHELIKVYGKGNMPGKSDNPFGVGSLSFTGLECETLNLWKLIYDHAD